ncbi:MAG TPA: FAD-binding oxidoreductase [Puia sp.]|nr:FAD-binding oxidoreductase [Puia sp.]
MKHIVKILSTKQVTHDVKCFRFEKPEGYHFNPGQATDVSINQKGLEEELRPFTFTALNDEPYLEFTIKRYPDHHGITDKLHQLNPGDEIIIHDVWGAIEYKGPGYFIAGGAGVTPFIAILRDLHKQHKIDGNILFFSNKTADDIIYKDELKTMLRENAVFLLTKENKAGYRNERIDKKFIEKNITDFNKHFYVCGPDEMIKDITKNLEDAGAKADAVVFEK